VKSFEGTRSNNWTKGNPCLSGDILGAWREEAIWRAADRSHLRLYATPHETDHRLYTLLHDPQYRTGIARQNVGYNQPPWPSFFLGHGMAAPPNPDIKTSFEPAGHDRLAEISASETDATLCDTIDFEAVDQTKGNTIRSLSWELGDGTTVSGRSVSHSYDELGVYSVELTATVANGETTDFETITVAELDPIARAVASATRVDMGESIDFEAEDISGEEYSIASLTWDFDDGTTATGWSATHTYDEPGEYAVTLNATAETGCTSSYTVPVTVEVAAGTYRLTARHTADDKVVEVADGSTADGANVQQGVWEGADYQRWTVTELEDGVYRIENVNSGLVMEAEDGASRGGNVVQAAWEGKDYQKWKLVPVSSGHCSLRPLHAAPDLAADVFGVSTEDGATIGIWSTSNNDNQQFAFLDPSA
ncbi:MAG: RICIN domain-containing protein, partial [Halobacteriaceae archaeon]